MTKRLVCLLLVALTVLGCPMYAAAQENSFCIFVDGQEVEGSNVMLENGVSYVSAQNVAQALIPDTTVTWSGGYSEMTLAGTGYTLSAQVGRDYVICNGRYLYTPGQVMLHPVYDDLLLPVRVLARALGAEVGWDPSGVYLTSVGAPLEGGDTFYNAGDLELMARTIRHEAGYESLEGQIAIGNVLLGRVRSSSFPGTLYDVIYQPNQFPGVQSLAPEERHYIAAKLCLDGAQTVPENAYWFNGVGKSCWASKNKSLLCTIGGHAFYG